MEVTQTERLGKGKPNSLFTFQREKFWRRESMTRRQWFGQISFQKLREREKFYINSKVRKREILACFPRQNFSRHKIRDCIVQFCTTTQFSRSFVQQFCRIRTTYKSRNFDTNFKVIWPAFNIVNKSYNKHIFQGKVGHTATRVDCTTLKIEAAVQRDFGTIFEDISRR